MATTGIIKCRGLRLLMILLTTFHLSQSEDGYCKLGDSECQRKYSYSEGHTISVGQPVNLIYGMKYGIDVGDLFYPPPTANIFSNADDITEEITLSNEFDSFPTITFCDNFTHLLQVFFDHFDPEDKLSAAGVMFQHGEESKTTSELASLIGVSPADANLSSNETSFVLARQWKRMTKKIIGGEPKLQPKINSTLRNIQLTEYVSILNAFSSIGSHYITGYTIGDVVYQVFAYEPEDYNMIKKRYPTEESRNGSSLVFSFPKYTEVKSEYAGYSKYYGDVKISSADPRFKTEIVPYLEDETNSVSQSIFRLAASRDVFDKLNDFNTKIIVSVALRGLDDFTTEEGENNTHWSNLLKSSLYLKFGSISRPHFQAFNVSPDYEKAFSQFAPLYPTMTSTYLLGMKYMYLDLNSVQIIESDKVKTLFLIASVIEISDDIILPGNANVIITCDLFISRALGNNMPTLTINVDPMNRNKFQIIANNFLGSMMLKSKQWPDNFYMTLYNGLSLVLGKSSVPDVSGVGLGPVTYTNLLPNISTATFLYKPNSQIYNSEWVITSFEDALTYFVVCIENILNYDMGEDGPDAAFRFASWITRSLNESMEHNSSYSGLEGIYVRALTLDQTRNPDRSERSVFVPYLTYMMYEKTINALTDLGQTYGTMQDRVQQRIEEQRLKEEIAKDQDALNKNIQNIGKFLSEQNKAIGDQEKDLSDFYNNVVADKQGSLKTALAQQNDLNIQLISQQYLLDVAQQRLEVAMKDKVAEDLFNAAVQVAVTCVDLYTSNVFKVPEDLKGLIDAAKKVKKSLEAIIAFGELMKAATSGQAFDKAIDSFNNMPYKNAASAFPTELDWYRYDSDVASVMNKIGVPEAGAFLIKAKMYTAIGKQYTATSQRICELQYDIAINTMQGKIHDKQRKRLADLEKQLSQPDLPTDEAMNIDLFQLGTTLQNSQQRVLLKLMDLMGQQDGALQYYTLQTPTPLTRYDILSVKDAIASRAIKSLRAFESFVPPPHELEQLRNVTIPLVPFNSLNESGFNFRVQLPENSFFSYVRVRITEIQVYIDNIVTDTGRLHVNIMGGGSNFFDRGLQRETLNYTTYPHIYPFTYDIDSRAIVAGNRISGDDLKTYNLMTPFTQWTIQTPANAPENKGIKPGSAGVTVHLRFRVSAIRHDASSGLNAASSSLDEKDLISVMSTAPVTYGWDVVSCMDAKRITDLFAEMYKDEEDHGLVYHIKTAYTSVNTSTYYAGTEFEGTVGPPLISFISNQPNTANLTMVYIEGRLVKATIARDSNSGKVISNDTTEIVFKGRILMNTHIVIIDGKVEINTTTKTNVKEIPNIVGIMLLSKLTGRVTNHHEVIINLGKGEFNTKLTLDPNFDNDLNDAVRNYFRKDLANYNYTLGTVIFETSNTPPALQPTLFEFGTTKPDGSPNGILLMFIKTNTSDSEIGAQTNLKLSVNPIPKGRTATLIISNKVLMKHFVVDGIPDPFHSRISVSSPHPYDTSYEIKGSGDTSVDGVKVSMENFDLKVGDEGKSLTLSWNNHYTQSYSYKVRSCHPTMPGCVVPSCMGGCTTDTEWADMPILINANGATPLDFKLDSDDSYITFAPFDIPVTVKFSPPKQSGWEKFMNFVSGSSSDMEATGKKVGESLQNNLKSVKVEISGVSVFAVSNLLFPGKKVMDLKIVYLAQDLVLFGDVKQ